MAMTAKDFTMIAEAIDLARKDCGPHRQTVDTVANHIGWALTDSNPRFDRARFLKACGV